MTTHVSEYLIGESASCWLALAGNKALIKRRDLETNQSLRALEIVLGASEIGFHFLCLQQRGNNYPLEHLFLNWSSYPLHTEFNYWYLPNMLWMLRLSRQGGSLRRGSPWELVLSFLIVDACSVVLNACAPAG